MARLSEGQVNAELAKFWRENGGAGGPPFVRDLWVEQCRVASADGVPEPHFTDLMEHFSWFFGRAAA